MEGVIVRVDKLKSSFEYDRPVLIFIDVPANIGNVLYCSATGHGEGDYNALIQQTRPITDEELESLWFYGYDLKNFKVVKKFMKK